MPLELELTWHRLRIEYASFTVGARTAVRRASCVTSAATSASLYGMSASRSDFLPPAPSYAVLYIGPLMDSTDLDPKPLSRASPDILHSTNCLQTGRDCVYPESDQDSQYGQPSRAESESAVSEPVLCESALIPAEESARLVNVLSHQPFAGFSGEYHLSEMSQWLFHQCKR